MGVPTPQHTPTPPAQANTVGMRAFCFIASPGDAFPGFYGEAGRMLENGEFRTDRVGALVKRHLILGIYPEALGAEMNKKVEEAAAQYRRDLALLTAKALNAVHSIVHEARRDHEAREYRNSKD